MALMLIVSWPCATGIPSRLRQSNNCARRIATKSCSCLFIPSIPAPRPVAASTNGAACFAMTFRCRRIETFYRHPALSGRAGRERSMKRWPDFPNPGCPEIVFSAHSVPVSVIEKGDPYQRQIEETVELVMRARRDGLIATASATRARSAPANGCSRRCTAPSGIWRRSGCAKFVLCPSLLFPTTWRRWARSTTRRAKKRRQLGIQQFEMTSGLNDSPAFIAALADLVVNAIGADRDHRDSERLVAAD